MILSFAYSLIYGVYCAVGVSMSNLLNPFGYSPTDISIAGGSSILAGVIGALVIGYFLDHTSLYRKTHITISFMALLSMILIVIVLLSTEANLVNIMVPLILFGISFVSFFPTSLSYGAELTFPLQPTLVNACMNLMGQLSAFVFMGVSSYITDVDAAHDNIKSLEAVK